MKNTRTTFKSLHFILQKQQNNAIVIYDHGHYDMQYLTEAPASHPFTVSA